MIGEGGAQTLNSDLRFSDLAWLIVLTTSFSTPSGVTSRTLLLVVGLKVKYLGEDSLL